jgi:hypothetical protein
LIFFVVVVVKLIFGAGGSSVVMVVAQNAPFIRCRYSLRSFPILIRISSTELMGGVDGEYVITVGNACAQSASGDISLVLKQKKSHSEFE